MPMTVRQAREFLPAAFRPGVAESFGVVMGAANDGGPSFRIDGFQLVNDPVGLVSGRCGVDGDDLFELQPGLSQGSASERSGCCG
jgi:hypothetical protein